jgi:uncharacterized membrane protein YdjX (TVP38/TMEM64 family)
MPATPNTAHPFAALSIAFIAIMGPLVGMTLIGLTAPAYIHLLENITPPLLALGLVFVGGNAVGLALLPSFLLGAICGYLLPGAWPYLATVPGLAWATALGLGLGRLFSTNFLEVLLQRKADWWSIYQRLVHTAGSFLPAAVALLRLSPHMPFALTNLVCARLPLTPARIWLFSFVGLLPRTLLAAYIGSQLQDWRSLLDRERPPWELLLSLVLLALFVYFTRQAARRFESSERH